MATTGTTTRKIPTWLTKHASYDYLTAVLDTLSDRETQRHLARQASLQSVWNGANPPSAQSKLRELMPNFVSSGAPDTKDHYSIKHGFHLDNRTRNRYTDIIPYDRTRIRVAPPTSAQTSSQETENGHYLNASWVLERYGYKWWIASQAPLPNTAYTFLSIFLQPSTSPSETILPSSGPRIRPKFGRIRTVVQLTQNVESGRRKAHAYFPSKVGSSQIILPDTAKEHESRSVAIKVSLLQEKRVKEANCIQSTISVSRVTLDDRRPSNSSPSESVSYTEDESSTVTFEHMLFTAWPDHGVPTPKDRASLLAFLHLVDKTNREIPTLSSPSPDTEIDPDPPIIVGCSAGIGRTGSFIALSSLLRAFGFLPPPNVPTDASVIPQSLLGRLPKEFEEDMVAWEIDSLREQRPRMVEREEQVECIYEVLAAAFEAEGTS